MRGAMTIKNSMVIIIWYVSVIWWFIFSTLSTSLKSFEPRKIRQIITYLVTIRRWSHLIQKCCNDNGSSVPCSWTFPAQVWCSGCPRMSRAPWNVRGWPSTLMHCVELFNECDKGLQEGVAKCIRCMSHQTLFDPRTGVTLYLGLLSHGRH